METSARLARAVEDEVAVAREAEQATSARPEKATVAVRAARRVAASALPVGEAGRVAVRVKTSTSGPGEVARAARDRIGERAQVAVVTALLAAAIEISSAGKTSTAAGVRMRTKR